jgi:hypothetical protein
VLLELFTSEGCSSCPPADALLGKIDGAQPIAGAQLIVLSEHVDYWNQLGWTDPYSSSDFSSRQQEYAERFGPDTYYTPELVVDGGAQVVGSNWPAAQRAILAALKSTKIPLKVSAEQTGNSVRIHAEATALGSEHGKGVLYVVLAANHTQSQVARGENAGHQLNHTSVALLLRKAATFPVNEGAAKDVAVELKMKAGQTGLRAIAFVQDVHTRHILGVAQVSVGNH